MSGILKLWKKIKWIRRIIAIASIVTTVVSVYLWFSDYSVYTGLRKQEDVGITSKLIDGSTAPSGSVQALLDWCEKIAMHYKKEDYDYDQSSGDWELKYDLQTNKGSCCTIYAQQALYAAGMLPIEDKESWKSIWKSRNFGDWLRNNPDWYELKEGDKEEAGDVHIYYGIKPNGKEKSHTNIYAGDGKYWDAGDPDGEKGAFNAEAIPHPSDYTYGIFRYVKASV